MDRKRILIVSPAAARDNNGNWQTASHWARFLRGRHPVDVAGGWMDGDPAPDLLIALHARRFIPALAALHDANAQRPILLVLQIIKHDEKLPSATKNEQSILV